MTKYFHYYKGNLDKIEQVYDPNFDRPHSGQPLVTWVDAYIAEALKAAIEEIEQLRREVDELRSATGDYVTVEEFNAWNASE